MDPTTRLLSADKARHTVTGVTYNTNGEERNVASVYSYGTNTSDKSTMEKAWCTRLFPTGFKRELKAISSLAWPAMLASLFVYSFAPVSLMFCGHLGRKELDGVSLANSLLNITGLSICTGMSTACDTFFSQAFGGNNKRMVGIYLQRSVAIIGLSCCLCLSIHLNAEPLLILVGQNPEIAKIAGEYLLYFSPGLIFSFLYQVLEKYLQNQNMVLPPVIIGAVGNGINALSQYVAVYVLEGGTRGSAMGQAVSYFAMTLLTIVYIIGGGIYKETWGGLSWKALEHWDKFLRVAIAGLFMVCVEWWMFETGIFMNGILGEVELGATTVVFQIEVLLYMVPFGISVATGIRVGQSLGAGDSDGAKTTARVAQVLSWVIFMVIAVLLLSLNKVLPMMFTSDSEVLNLSSTILKILVIYMFEDSMTGLVQGILRGCGRQFIGAVCNTLGYVFIGIPVAIVLLFVVKTGSTGFWWGIIIGAAPISCLFLIIMWRTDWNQQVQNARERISEGSSNRHVLTDKTPLLSENISIEVQPDKADNDTPNGNFKSSSVSESMETTLTTSQKIHLCLKRLLTCFIVIGVLIAGILIRLFVETPDQSWFTVNLTNYTTPYPMSDYLTNIYEQ